MTPLDALWANQRRRVGRSYGFAVLGLGGLAMASLLLGASAVGAHDVWAIASQILHEGRLPQSREGLVLFTIRLHVRSLPCWWAGLAVAGAMLQGLFRNPLADPGLIGVSSGAALAAGLTIVLGDAWLAPHFGRTPLALLPVGAFFGGLATTLLLYAIATRRGQTSIATLLLAGVAIGALAGAMSGFLAYLSDDRQLRDLAFWTLGSLSGASWAKLAAAGPLLFLAVVAAPLLARGLDALNLGDAEAFHLGQPVQRIKILAILFSALAVGASVAVAGMIGFVGIVVPHALRLLVGASHRTLLPLSALGGAALLLAADLVARLAVMPAELPIGIVTAAVGAHFSLASFGKAEEPYAMTAWMIAESAGFRTGQRWLLREANLALAAGQFRIVVIGPNGAGKSTLLRLLSGEWAPAEGHVMTLGQPIGAVPAWQLAARRVVHGPGYQHWLSIRRT